ncbi:MULTISPECIES: hypothetical protein [unclassified Methylomonas]|uniref:hypothetical protein n=1 Tax=unclassified Methylomonas TaxID=2608980 RepID=UPI001CEC2D27|nr:MULTISPECIES: hypothetical protein [unclassified Methylomonas]
MGWSKPRLVRINSNGNFGRSLACKVNPRVFPGYENDAKYQARKQEKLAIYQKHNFNLIELTDTDVLNLDDILPRVC